LLDALVAERVMGWTDVAHNPGAPFGYRWYEYFYAEGGAFSGAVSGWSGHAPTVRQLLPVPEYSTSTADSARVLAMMRKRGFRLRLTEYSDGYYAAFAESDIDSAAWTATQEPTLPAAICRAALAAFLLPTMEQ
jgi:hypothetical protein